MATTGSLSYHPLSSTQEIITPAKQLQQGFEVVSPPVSWTLLQVPEPTSI
ncbi:hypothetical protein CLAFUW4_13947 [Fulvia fulva]|nr:uncharacterized protein CLAFUR5_20365 [Fulvia fulva]KAK4610137.1 hypothetical protein CLAFUR4_13950 [Fulvia fulva]KAK4611394.1 hypothetical protein CLAFUR0_13954 [Fulvia fulva]WMI39075.1 hypothetical protein CLAFUR5_20365 [Fulvia fulva]WPV21863.1 hypothetical protein CLAFUW4_13947 [Fulvia fulva]WPV37058.1 hypothetical protein CLAFUW7_13955 [Fulvia fulva]